MEVLLAEVPFGRRSVADFARGIVLLNQVLDDLSVQSLVIMLQSRDFHLALTAPDSQRVMPVLGSSIAGTLGIFKDD